MDRMDGVEWYTRRMAPEISAPVSIDEFWHLAHRLPRAELVGGLVVEVVHPGLRHGVLVSAITECLRTYVVGGGLGVVAVESGFVLSTEPPTVRAPDVAVVLKPRVPSPLPAHFFPGSPDLAVEVLSPDDTSPEVAARIADYLEAGTGAVWVVNPQDQTLTVHTASGSATYHRHETLRDQPMLPGFELRLQGLFE